MTVLMLWMYTQNAPAAKPPVLPRQPDVFAGLELVVKYASAISDGPITCTRDAGAPCTLTPCIQSFARLLAIDRGLLLLETEMSILLRDISFRRRSHHPIDEFGLAHVA